MFDDLHDPDPPKPGLDTLASVSSRAQRIRRRRSMTIAGSSLAVVALVAAVVVIPRLGDDNRITTVDNTIVDETLVDDTVATVPVSTGAVATVVPSDCTTTPRPPVYLVDGTVPADGVTSTNDDGTTSIRWGTDDANPVTQIVGADAPFVDSPATLERGDFTATVVPVGDPPLGGITIVIADASDGCERVYSIGPRVDEPLATSFATQWISYLDVDRTLTVSGAPDSLVCTYVGGLLVECLDVPQDAGGQMLVRARSDAVGPSVNVLQVLVVKGAQGEPSSSLARRVPVEGNPALELIVDVVPACGVFTLTTGESIEWGPDGTAATCTDDAPDASGQLPLAALDANGDAVLIEALDGTSTVLSDGPDPDDPPPDEGDVTALDRVALSPDGTFALVGSCCEPIPGSITRVDLTNGEETFWGYGHLPSFTADGMVVTETLGVVSLRDADGNEVTALHEVDPSQGAIIDLAVIGEAGAEYVLAIVASTDGTTLWRGAVAGGDVQMSTVLSTAPWTADTRLSLAGWLIGRIFVLDDANDRVLEFNTETLEPQVVPDIAFLEISRWTTSAGTVTVDEQRQLFIDEVQVPGEYLWAR